MDQDGIDPFWKWKKMLMSQFSKPLVRVLDVNVTYYLKLRYIIDLLFEVGQKDELYCNYVLWFLEIAWQFFGLSGSRVLLLDGHIDQCRKLFLYYQLRFEPMESCTLVRLSKKDLT